MPWLPPLFGGRGGGDCRRHKSKMNDGPSNEPVKPLLGRRKTMRVSKYLPLSFLIWMLSLSMAWMNRKKKNISIYLNVLDG